MAISVCFARYSRITVTTPTRRSIGPLSDTTIATLRAKNLYVCSELPLLQLLKDCELDVLIASWHIATSGLVFTKLIKETFLLVGHQPLNLPSDVVLALLEQCRWISYASDNPIIRRFSFKPLGCARHSIRNELADGHLHELWPPAAKVDNDLWLVSPSSAR